MCLNIRTPFNFKPPATDEEHFNKGRMNRSAKTRGGREGMMRAAFLLVCVGIAGCVSVPLSTIVRMSSFDASDFAQLDPDVVRVRITLPEGFALDAAKSALGVRIESAAGVHHGEFRLDQESEARTRVAAGMFARSTPGTAYTLKLSVPSGKEFRKLQAFVGKGPPGQITIGIKPILASFPGDAASVNVWIDLLLSEHQGYFTLLDAAELPMEQIRQASSGA